MKVFLTFGNYTFQTNVLKHNEWMEWLYATDNLATLLTMKGVKNTFQLATSYHIILDMFVMKESQFAENAGGGEEDEKM